MLKKIVSCALSATVLLGLNASLLSVSADDEVSPSYVYNNQMSAFDFVKSKRNFLSGDEQYTLDDCISIREFLLKRFDGNKFYAKHVAVSFDCQGIAPEDYSDPGVLDTKIVYAGSTIIIPSHALKMENCSHGGWWYNGNYYVSGESFTVPDENVVFTPYWFKYHTLTYLAGDYDDIVGSKTFATNVTEGTNYDLASSSRFSRLGYNLVGWECSLDGKVYAVNQGYTIPDSDITFTAVWSPMKVNISISANNGNYSDNITDSAYTGDEYQLPECSFTNGDKTFIGWKFKDNIYQPGETITIPALLKGEKVIITAQWE